MSDFNLILLYLGLSFALIVLKLLMGGLRDLMTPLCLFYFYFAFGPVINYVNGSTIYFGIPKEYIPEASLIFLIAIATMVIGSILWRSKPIPEFKIDKFGLNLLNPIFFISILYALYVIAIVSVGGGASKGDKIALAIPVLHYNYLLLQIYLISFFFLMQPGLQKKLYWTNTIIYLVYSLVIGERDFIFPVMSIVFHRFLFAKSDTRGNIKLILSIFGMMAFATIIFYVRDATQSSGDGVLAGILNQGSLLFVNTFSLKILAERFDYFMGFTYLNSLQNLLPSFIYKTDFNTLEWFRNQYAAASTSGYGYGLDAEGYINFSYFGVALTFFAILFFQRKITKNFTTHPFFVYYSVFFTGFTMYSLRNDSLAFLKGNLYAVIFFFFVRTFSYKKEAK